MTQPIHCSKDVKSMSVFCTASTTQLNIPSIRLPTVGSRAFPVAGASVWNSLPDDVTSAPSLPTFRCHLEIFVLSLLQHYLILLVCYSDSVVVFAVAFAA